MGVWGGAVGGALVCRGGCTSPRGQGPLQLFSKDAVLLHEKCAAKAESLPAPPRRLLYIRGNGSLEKWEPGRGGFPWGMKGCRLIVWLWIQVSSFSLQGIWFT